MTKRIRWTIAFLTLTAAPVALECWAGLDSDPDTIPWTDYVSSYVPWPIALAAFLALAAWLPPHFVEHYRLKAAEKRRKAVRASMAGTAVRRARLGP